VGCDAIVHVVVLVRAGKGEGWTAEVSMIAVGIFLFEFEAWKSVADLRNARMRLELYCLHDVVHQSLWIILCKAKLVFIFLQPSVTLTTLFSFTLLSSINFGS
jgi:hypothetical protein